MSDGHKVVLVFHTYMNLFTSIFIIHILSVVHFYLFDIFLEMATRIWCIRTIRRISEKSSCNREVLCSWFAWCPWQASTDSSTVKTYTRRTTSFYIFIINIWIKIMYQFNVVSFDIIWFSIDVWSVRGWEVMCVFVREGIK